MQCKDNANIIQIFIYYFHAHSSVLTHKTCIFNVKWCEGLQLLVQTRKNINTKSGETRNATKFYVMQVIFQWNAKNHVWNFIISSSMCACQGR